MGQIRRLKNADGVDMRLLAILSLAAHRSPESFVVTSGVRSRAEQAKLVEAGKSRTMNSKHLTGDAIDLAIIRNGVAIWHFPLYEAFDRIVQEVARELTIPVFWGGNWTNLRDGAHWHLLQSQQEFSTTRTSAPPPDAREAEPDLVPEHWVPPEREDRPEAPPGAGLANKEAFYKALDRLADAIENL